MQYGASYLRLFDEQLSLQGAGPELNVRLGGTPVTNFVVFGEVSVQLAPSPTAELGGQSYETNDSTQLSFNTIGPGVAYYFGPSSFFVSGTLGLAAAELDAGGHRATANGFGFRLGVGKEWWVSDQWGIGLAANYSQASVTDDVDAEFTSRAFGLSFSATYH